MERDGILIFHSLHKVMHAESVLRSAGVNVRLLPVPRQLSSDCGLSLAFFVRDWEVVRMTLDGAGCREAELHIWDGKSYRSPEGL